MLGILTRSVPECYTDLPRDAQRRFRAYRFEIATTTSSVYETLFLQSRVLADDIFIRDQSYYKSFDLSADHISSQFTEMTPNRSTTILSDESSAVTSYLTDCVTSSLDKSVTITSFNGSS